jgi:5-methyltetrahydropteroyltriglutamate--homocysteine methyltransferase
VRSGPPFRAEHIGSLLRPPGLIALRREFAQGRVGQDELAQAENRAIVDAVHLQEAAGLRAVTDGEFRRESYHSFFYGQLGDVTIAAPATAVDGQAAQPTAIIRSRLAWTHPIHVEDFKFLRQVTGALPKITIPGPCALHFRGGDAAVTASAYRDVDTYWSDTVAAFRQELQALADAGCTYVQIDETAFAKFGDPDVQQSLSARGDDWRTLIDSYIDVTNHVTHGFPTLHIGMHLCRGNRGGHWHAQGGYDAVADKLFNRLDIGFFFLEYDSPRAGDFTPLRFVPKTKLIVLGLVSTKTSALEDKAELKQRIDAASRYVDLDRLGISPQCGFASVETGNPITPSAQGAKLRLVAELAREVWGPA